jgi:hypothetical protein
MSRAVSASPPAAASRKKRSAQKSDAIPLRSQSPNRVGPEPPSGLQTYRLGRILATSALLVAVERGGNLRSFHAAVEDKETVSKIVLDNVTKEARLFTDESRLYCGALISSRFL